MTEKMDARRADAILASAELVCSEVQVVAAYDQMATAIKAKLHDKDPVALCALVGGLVPAVELTRRFDFPHSMDFAHLTRYRGGTRGGDLQWIARPRLSLRDRHVLIIDDIYDEGLTLAELTRHCLVSGALSVSAAVLVRKRHDRPVAGGLPEFVGLEVADRYVFGCGMDYLEHFRNLPAIYALPDD